MQRPPVVGLLLLLLILTQGNWFELDKAVGDMRDLGVDDGFERVYLTVAGLPCLVGQASAATEQRGIRNKERGAGTGGNGKRGYCVIAYSVHNAWTILKCDWEAHLSLCYAERVIS